MGMAVYHMIGRNEVTAWYLPHFAQHMHAIMLSVNIGGSVFPGTLLVTDAGKQPLADGCLPRDRL